MSFLPGDLVVFGTVALASLVGMFWLSRRVSAMAAAEEMPTLRLPRTLRTQRTRVAANDNAYDDDVPESGIRLKPGAGIRHVDSRR